MKKLIVAVLLGVLGSAAVAENCGECEKLSLKPLDLSRTPTHEELIQSGQLGGPLSPTGPEAQATDADRLLFGQAMDAWNRHDYKKALPLLKRHSKQFRGSPWRAEAELHLGCEARFNGRYAEAEDYFKAIIADNEKAGRALVDFDERSEVARKARLRMGMLEFLRGNFDESERIWTEILETDSDRRRVDYARHWLRRTDLFRANAAETRRCAVESLSKFAEVAADGNAATAFRSVPAHPDYGFRADELIALAKSQGIELSGVQAKRVKDLPAPFIAHYRFKHFVTVTGMDGKGRVTVFDPILNHEVRMSEADFSREWSGFALIPSGKIESKNTLLSLLGFGRRFEVVSATRLPEITGGCCGIENANQDEGSNGPLLGGPCGGYGLCTWAFNPVSMNVFVWDTPLWYEPAIGPAIEFTMSYNAIDADNNLPSFGPKWFLNYHSYAVETPATSNGSVTVFMPDGRNDVYSPISGTNVFSAPARVFNKLTKVTTNQYTLELPDGTVYQYGPPAGATNVQQALLSRIVDRHSNTVTMLYDGQPNPKLTGVIDALSQTSRLYYSASGLITNMVDPYGRTASVTYSNGYVATVTDMGGVQSVYSFNDGGAYKDYVQSVRTMDGTVTFSFTNNWKRETITATYEDGTTEVLYYNGGESYPYSTTFTDRSGNQTRYALKLNAAFPYQGAIDYAQHPDGSRVYYKYNAALQTTNVIDELGKTWAFQFNEVGRLTQMVTPSGYQSAFTYTNGGFDLATASEAGTQVLSIGYDAKRDIAAITNALNQPTRFSYDAYGRMTNVTDAAGIATAYEYGPDFWLSRIARAGYTLATYSLDEKGRVTNAVGPHGVSTAYEYDGLNRLTGLTLPGERSYAWVYETNSLNLQKTLDRTGRRTLFAYNEANRLTKVAAHDWSFTGFEYAGDGNISALTDAEGNKTRFSYDTRGRMAQKTYPEGDGVQAGYTSNSLLQTFTSGRGIVTTHKYDPAGLLTNISYSATNTPTMRFRYDNRNRLVWMADGWSTNSYFYDTASRLTNVVEVQGASTQQWTYGFDSLDRLTEIVWQVTGNTNRFATVFQHDSLDRVTNIMSRPGAFGVAYTNAGLQVARIAFPNGQTIARAYDGLGRLTNLTHAGGTWAYGFDTRDQIIRCVDPSNNVFTSRYDDQGRLIETLALNGTNVLAQYPQRFIYDRVGNRVQATEGKQQRSYTYNVNNQLKLYERPKSTTVRGYVNEASTIHVRSNTATNWIPAVTRFVSYTQVYYEAEVAITNWGTNNYVWVRASDFSGSISTSRVRVTSYWSVSGFQYDADGNQLTTLAATNTFDARNRLIQARYGNGYTVFKYDGFNRLREVGEYNSVGTLTGLVRYAWQGWLPWAELDSANKPMRLFTWGPDRSGTIGGAGGIGGILAAWHTNNVSYFYRPDGLGNITEVVQTNGVIVRSQRYSPYGKIISSTGTYNQVLGLQSKVAHARSETVFFGGRFYNPATGTWLSRDPSGEGSGVNLYQYCYSSPLSFYDPDGEVPILGIMLAGAVYAAVFTPLNANAPGPDDFQLEPTTPEEVVMNAAVGGLTAGALAWAGSAIGSIGGRNACPKSVTVTRWQTPPSQSLRPGNWVVRGEKNAWNYLMSGKYNPLRPRYHVPYKYGRTFEVPPATLKPPTGMEAFKTYSPWRQSRFYPPTE
jgi:RHS repeat-associated protein